MAPGRSLSLEKFHILVNFAHTETLLDRAENGVFINLVQSPYKYLNVFLDQIEKRDPGFANPYTVAALNLALHRSAQGLGNTHTEGLISRMISRRLNIMTECDFNGNSALQTVLVGCNNAELVQYMLQLVIPAKLEEKLRSDHALMTAVFASGNAQVIGTVLNYMPPEKLSDFMLAKDDKGVSHLDNLVSRAGTAEANAVLQRCPENIKEAYYQKLYASFLDCGNEAAESVRVVDNKPVDETVSEEAKDLERQKQKAALDHMSLALVSRAQDLRNPLAIEEMIVDYFKALSTEGNSEQMTMALRLFSVMIRSKKLPPLLQKEFENASLRLRKENLQQWKQLPASSEERTHFRTPSEVVVHLMADIRKMRQQDPENKVLENLDVQVQSLFLQHHMNIDETRDFLSKFENDALKEGLPNLASLCHTLQDQLPLSSKQQIKIFIEQLNLLQKSGQTEPVNRKIRSCSPSLNLN